MIESEHSHVFPQCQPVLEVRDVQAAIDWYLDKLAFELEFKVGEPPIYACLGRNVCSKGAPACLRFTEWCRDRDEPANSGWLAIYVGDHVNELYEEFRAKGVTFSRELANHEYGMREFEIRDCNGHYLRFGGSIEE